MYENFELENFKKKGKLKDKLKKGLKKVGGFAKNAGQVAASNTALLPLAPFRVAMAGMLKKRGVKFKKGNLFDIAQKFYHYVILKKQNFETFDPVTISLALSAITSFFKELAKKKEEGKATAEEKKAVDDTENELKRMDVTEEDYADAPEEEDSEKNDSDGEEKSNNTLYLLILAAVVLFALKN